MSTLKENKILDEIDLIDLTKNENPHDVSENVKSSIIRELHNLNRYPVKLENDLKNNLAKFHNVHSKNVLMANGSSEVLDLIFRSHLTPSSEVIIPDLTFVLYDKLAITNNAKMIKIPHTNGHQDLDKIHQAINSNTNLIALVNPSNPMGYIIEPDHLEKFIQNVPEKTLIIIDEAYSQYVDNKNYQSAIPLTLKYPHCVVIKTFSKAYGLSGLRMGYCIAHENVIKKIEPYTFPFMINSLSLAGAYAAISDEVTLRAYRRKNRDGLNQLMRGCDKLGLKYYGDAGNFLTIKLPGLAKPLCHTLEKEGINIKDLAEYGLPDHIRVSVGLPIQNERVVEKLTDFYKIRR